jgi:hypothetical protein
MEKLKTILLDYRTWGIAGLAIGFIIAFLIWGGKPDVQKTKDKIITKTTTNATYDKSSKTNLDVVGAKKIDIKPDGTASFSGDNMQFKIDSEITDKLVLRIQELEKELKTTTTINYTAFLGLGTNPFNLPEINATGGLKLLGPIWLSDASSYDFKTGVFKTSLTALYFF